MNRSSSGLQLPLPGSPGSSWAVYRSRIAAIFQGADTAVLIAFWLFGLINNVLYVIILSAALDLVGPDVPKGVVLLADVVPSFITKLVAPYFIHKVPYRVRILTMCVLSSGGILLVALTPSAQGAATGTAAGDGSIIVKLFGVMVASLSSGMGELSFLGLTHYYGRFSLAAWGSGTGGAGLIGAGLYVLLTTVLDLSVRTSLLSSAFLPAIMLAAFFLILPHGPLDYAKGNQNDGGEYNAVPTLDIDDVADENIESLSTAAMADSLLSAGPTSSSEAYTAHSPRALSPSRLSNVNDKHAPTTFLNNLRRARALFIPYMLPLLLVYIGEYTINQGVAPTLLFPLPSTPFSHYRAFYPTYGLIYQVGVFIARSSTPFYRIQNLYLPAVLQLLNLAILTSHALWFWIPSVWLVFALVLWEGLLGGAVYVNTFAKIMDRVDIHDREFSLGATSVSDSGGICIAGFLGMAMEVWLCNWQVERGRNWCKML